MDPVAARREVAVDDREYLLCIHNDRSFVVRIPTSGELVVGRGPDAGLSIDDPLVSRAHAQLLVVPDGLRLMDLGSRHGTLVNGERVIAPRLVVSGDVVTIGNVLVVVRHASRSVVPSVSDLPVLSRRLAEELSRVAEYERELAILVFRFVEAGDHEALLAAIGDRLRVIDTAATIGPRHVGIVAPELGADAACELARAIVALDATSFAAGIAIAPFDGIDADALVATARSAATAAKPGCVELARDVAETIVAGTQRIIVADPAMARLYELARRLARSTIPVLIEGETGVGKELAAAAVHAFSSRSAGPFISMNCAAIAETLAESELFGYAKGAFTGAMVAKPGHLEVASGGTLFLDEIGELSPAIQAKLLRVLENGEFVRVGETKPRTTDLRIVAATNRDLQTEVDKGRFRSDLYFRLGAARLAIPPLRDRPRDLALLAAHMLDQACHRLARPPLQLSIAAAVALFRHDWAGNIRELRHVVDYAATTAPDNAVEIELWHLPASLATEARKARDANVQVASVESSPSTASPGATTFRPIADEVRELERSRMVAAMRACGGVQNRAAELIEMPLRTFVTKLKRYAITDADWSDT
ncbi:MAG TPA: sigma 54-interacting transcriptional regulator [Kofleriaceae bacterium]|nr:sigma 54-interacting transcriptional regulator [Kofleriaceae bacterium]